MQIPNADTKNFNADTKNFNADTKIAEIAFVVLTFKSQHWPVAQDALECRVQECGSQQGFLQCSGNPQSHSSPSSTKELPQMGESKSMRGLLRRQ